MASGKNAVLAVLSSRFLDYRLAMKLSATCALALLAVGVAALSGCAPTSNHAAEPVRTVSVASDNPFGGAPAIDIPSDARAMGAFLKAEVATNEGDREEALKDYAEAVEYDPNNAALRVSLATLYVRDGRLKDALGQVNRALAANPGSATMRSSSGSRRRRTRWRRKSPRLVCLTMPGRCANADTHHKGTKSTKQTLEEEGAACCPGLRSPGVSLCVLCAFVVSILQ